jgi:Base plate wedge protein 53
MPGFFNYFPTLLYRNTPITNVIAKVRFRESIRTNAAVFYTYTVKEGERADQIAEHYYGDAHYDWLIYLANDIVDPYHEWPKDQTTLDQFVKSKYGSIADAEARIKYYRVNYDLSDDVISTAVFDALSAGQKKYWTQVYNLSGQVVGYERREQDLSIDTNSVVQLTGTFSVTSGQLLRQGTATGEVVYSDSTTAVLKNIYGTWASGGSVVQTVGGASVNATITDVSTLPGGIPIDEVTYWTPTTCYEYEQELNEARKNIRLVHTSFANRIERDMKELLAA